MQPSAYRQLPSPRGSHGSGVLESTPAGSCVFLSDPDPYPESKIFEKPEPESLFIFGSSRSLCGHFLSKHMSKFRLDGWYLESEHESDSQIWKNSGSGFKNLGTGAELDSEKVTLATSAWPAAAISTWFRQEHAATSVANAALVASQWQHRTWTFTLLKPINDRLKCVPSTVFQVCSMT